MLIPPGNNIIQIAKYNEYRTRDWINEIQIKIPIDNTETCILTPSVEDRPNKIKTKQTGNVKLVKLIKHRSELYRNGTIR
mgnify:CR=1 FL=1